MPISYLKTPLKFFYKLFSDNRCHKGMVCPFSTLRDKENIDREKDALRHCCAVLVCLDKGLLNVLVHSEDLMYVLSRIYLN